MMTTEIADQAVIDQPSQISDTTKQGSLLPAQGKVDDAQIPKESETPTPEDNATQTAKSNPSEEPSDNQPRRDSGLASLELSPAQGYEHVPKPPNESRVRICETSKPTVGAGNVNTGARPKSPSIADAKSIGGKSVGGRSTAAVSTISPEDEVLSLRVRSLYDAGDAGSQLSGDPSRRRVSGIIEERRTKGNRLSNISNKETEESNNDRQESSSKLGTGGDLEPVDNNQRPVSEQRAETIAEAKSLDEGVLNFGGSIDDWEDVNGADVDRYGFIKPTYIPSSAAGPDKPIVAPKRVATALFEKSQRRKRPHALQHLRLSPSTPDMLRSPLPDQIISARDKESSRAKKWRQMAVLRKRSERGAEGGKGGGVEWSFVTRDPKLISRTWKGIPDCWRAAAWHAFLTASAKKRGIGKTDMELAESYRELILQPSADDVQIDLDVPRTISSHIMFRRRYRGGQRLLFRVLHCLSLQFPVVGYVQGMASLAATLLCYYEEETAFIMLVRLWELRGLEKLYESGFGGLMGALDEFETVWLNGGPISRKLTKLGINSTAYGTRWYLTLFNYSIPFPAQLRVWDVFMLLGDPDPSSKTEFGGTLDILHATSTTLIDSMKSIIARADFEEAMKALTSFIPVKDEDTLMKVAKAQWKSKRRRHGVALIPS